MRLEGHRVVEVGRGVEVWLKERIDVPLEVVLRRGLTDFYSMFRGWLPEPTRQGSDRLGRPDAIVAVARPVAFSMPSGEMIEGHGTIVATDEAALLEVLVERYQPRTDGDLEDYIRRLRQDGTTPAATRRHLRTALRGTFTASVSEGVSVRRVGPSQVGSPIVLVPRENQRYARVDLPRGVHAFATTPRGLLLQHEHRVHLGPLAVPRVRALFAPEPQATGPVTVWDGVRLSRLRGFADVPEDLWTALDEEGTSLIAAEGSGCFLPELSPRFIVEVPPGLLADARSHVADVEPPHAALRDAAFLFDSRSMVPLLGAGGEPPVVLQGEVAARFVLERALRGGRFYLPSLRTDAVASAPRRDRARADASPPSARRAKGMSWSSPHELWNAQAPRTLVGALPAV